MTEIYPISNRQEGLGHDYHSISRRVGAYLQHGLSKAQWPDDVRETVDDIMREGALQYYFPEVLPEPFAQGASSPHRWSWLRPVWTLTTQGDQREYNLPQDFESPIGHLTFPDSTSSFYVPLRQAASTRLRSLEFQTQFTSHPEYYAIDSKESQGDSPQTQVVILHPTPNGEYKLKLQYQSSGREMTPEHPYPLGGHIHSHGILASCLAVAEARKTGDPNGPLYRRYMQILTSNVLRDYERGAQTLGMWQNSVTQELSRARIRESGGIFYSDVRYSSSEG